MKMFRKIALCLIIMMPLFSLSACGKLFKSDQKLLEGNWEHFSPVSFNPAANNGANFESSRLSVQNFDSKEGYQLNKKKHELTFSGQTYAISFDFLGNVLTLTNEKANQKINYYRQDSKQYQKAKKDLKSNLAEVNGLWKDKQQGYIEKFEQALTGTWSNKESNAKVNLKHDSPDLEAKLVISNPHLLTFDISFFGTSHDRLSSAQFENKQVTDAKLKFSEDDGLKLIGNDWQNQENFKLLKEKMTNLTLRDLFMKLGEVTLAYTVKNSELKQEISVSAYGAKVRPNQTFFDKITVETYGNTFNVDTFKIYLTAER